MNGDITSDQASTMIMDHTSTDLINPFTESEKLIHIYFPDLKESWSSLMSLRQNLSDYQSIAESPNPTDEEDQREYGRLIQEVGTLQEKLKEDIFDISKYLS